MTTTSRIPIGATMLGAALLTAQFVAARAARDAIYLTHLDVTTLPEIVIATAVCSIGLVAVTSATFRRWAPATFVTAAFGLSGLLFLVEWLLIATAPNAIARLLYLHVSGFGPLLASAFWLIATETFDPRSAKKYFGRVGGAGTVGGILGGLLAERVASLFDAPAILVPIAVLNFVCAWHLRRLAQAAPAQLRVDLSPELSAASAGSGLRALAATPYLRDLGALVLLGTAAAALLDYVFKVHAVDSLGRGTDLLRFFAIYYAGVSAVTFVMQLFGSQAILERLGLVAATTTPSVATMAGGVLALLVPGLPSIVLARGSESSLRGSLFRAGYEIFYTPVPQAERRAAKSIVDVGCDRAGDAIGAALIPVVHLMAISSSPTIIMLAIACSAGAIAASTRLRRGYVTTLEQSLMHRAVELDLSEIQDVTTRTAMFRAIGPVTPAAVEGATEPGARSAAGSRREFLRDPEMRKIAELRSRDRDRVLRVLQDRDTISAALVPHIVPLLAWDEVADAAVDALRAIAEERIGELTDTLLDRNQPFAVRRRLARVFSVCVSQRAADGLVAALDDLRFEVRFQVGRSLAAIRERNPNVHVASARVFEAIDREISVSAPVWQSRQLLDHVEETSPRSAADEFLSVRANQSLSHVFTLLSLVLPSEPLRIAFRGLHTTDRRLRGTALEYLEHVLPETLRKRLWPFLDAPATAPRTARPRSEVLEDLVSSNPSIMLNLEELRRSRDREGA